MTTCTDCGRDLSERAPICPHCGAPGPAAVAAAVPLPHAIGQPATAADPQTRQWALWLHLSMLAGFVVPLAGLVAPIVIWQVKKTDLPGLDAHGKNAVNWIISAVIYTVVSIILAFVLIGIPMLLALFVLWIVFPVIAAVKGNNGEVWAYPMSIAFLK